jgi:hypothetical protein
MVFRISAIVHFNLADNLPVAAITPLDPATNFPYPTFCNNNNGTGEFLIRDKDAGIHSQPR